MPHLRRPAAVALALAGLACAAAPAAAADYADTALNIIPSGQYGAVPAPPGADEQARLYDGLTPLGGDVTTQDLFTLFKSARFGVDDAGPWRVEAVPRHGVRIVRDRFGVPHVTGATRDDVTWATGWIVAQDRALLLEQGRYAARLAAIDAPNINAFGLVVGLRQYTPSRQVERIVARQAGVLRRAGRKGRALLHDVDVYVRGINARLRADGSRVAPWTRVDVFAVNALVGQIFGEGGGQEVRSAQLLAGLRGRLGRTAGTTLWHDLTERKDPETPVTVDGSFASGAPPHSTPGNAIIDAGSFKASVPAGGSARAAGPPHASNFLMVGARRSTSGRPLFVAGPQIGYFYPGLTLEVDLRGPGFQARGASAPGFAGNVLIGRGPDFAWSLTSAGSDIIDQYVETLCGGSTTRYRHRGRCRAMGGVSAGVIRGAGTVRFRTTVHGPVVGYARVGGRRVAISRKRASFGRDILFQLPFRDVTLNRVTSAESFVRAFQQSPFTFNAAYADDRDIAMYSAGDLPVRAPGVDSRLPTKGTGAFEWRGFLRAARHPQAVNAKDGTLVNWNNKPGRGLPAADDNFSYGPVHRVALLNAGLAARPEHDLTSVTAAMNRAATQDLRVAVSLPAVAAVLAGGPAPGPRAQRMLELLLDYRAQGASRLDLDGDGKVDHPGAAIMDATWKRIVDAALAPVLGPQLDELKAIAGADANPADGFTNGSLGYVDKDLRTLLGRPVRGAFATRFCGRGDLGACRAALWGAVEAAGAELAATQGDDPAAWRADADAERIGFAPGLLPTTIRYTNRPSGIQQLMSFKGHRPER